MQVGGEGFLGLRHGRGIDGALVGKRKVIFLQKDPKGWWHRQTRQPQYQYAVDAVEPDSLTA